MNFIYTDKDRYGNEHYIISLTPLYELKLNGSVLETTLLLDGEGDNGIHFIISKDEISEIHIIDLEINFKHRNKGYGTLLLKSLFLVAESVKINKFYISGKIDVNDNVIKNINFYKNFVNIPFLAFNKEIEIYFYKNQKEKVLTENVYESRWFEYHIKN